VASAGATPGDAGATWAPRACTTRWSCWRRGLRQQAAPLQKRTHRVWAKERWTCVAPPQGRPTHAGARSGRACALRSAARLLCARAVFARPGDEPLRRAARTGGREGERGRSYERRWTFDASRTHEHDGAARARRYAHPRDQAVNTYTTPECASA
jgi:hypothetical protein